MPRPLLLALILLVAAPLALLGWVSASAFREQQQAAQSRLQGVYQARLAEIDQSLGDVFDAYARDLNQRVAAKGSAIENLRSLDRDHPLVRACMYVDRKGMLVYPPAPVMTSGDSVALYAALPAIVDSRPGIESGNDLGDLAVGISATESQFPSNAFSDQATKPPTAGVQAPTQGKLSTREKLPPQQRSGESIPQSSSSPFSKTSRLSKASGKAAPRLPTAPGDSRWQTWYMDEGIQLIYWVPQANGAASGILLERARWVSDLTAALPDSPQKMDLSSRLSGEADQQPSTGFTVIADEAQQVVYRWGGDGTRVDPPLATRSLEWPLASWRLEYHDVDPIPGSPSVPLIASLAGIGVVLLALGTYVMTGVQRQMRTARSRVTFASQVSHELRTPLTNIRLYAELAELDVEKMPPGESRQSLSQRLQVIDSESRRLGRLVSGVLEMIRDDRRRQEPRIRICVPDEIVEQALVQFSPSFERSSIDVTRDYNASDEVGIDADILEMILVNLLSNVEKYAAEGRRVQIRTRIEQGFLVVRVADNGSGIAKRHRAKVFRPFARLDDSIEAPSGTGIGLTIARRLARRHGGDLAIVPSDVGACFEFRLATHPPQQESRPETGQPAGPSSEKPS